MAVTLTLNELAVHLGFSVSDTVPPHHAYAVMLIDGLAAATEWVERRAPLAPSDSQNMAVTQIVAYWFESPRAAPQRFGYNAWLHSGAAQILGPFIERRAQAV